MPFFVDVLDPSPLEIGLFTTGLTVAVVPLAYAGDRYDKRLVPLGSLVVVAGAYLGFVLAESSVDLVLARGLQGVAITGTGLMTLSLVGALSPPDERANRTVRKRIQRLEDDGVIKGYSAELDYGRSGYPLRMLLFCTASIPERGEPIPDILAIDGVVSVREPVTGEEDLLVTAVGETDEDVTPVAQELLEMGLTVADEVLVRSHETTPFGEFDPD